MSIMSQLFNVLDEYEISGKVHRVIESSHDDTKFRIKMGEEMSDSVRKTGQCGKDALFNDSSIFEK